MTKFSTEDCLIRDAAPTDVSEILALVAELAEFEHLSHALIATEEDYQKSLFGKNPAAEALVAEVQGKIVGYAIFFSTFSTFIGRAGIWLEDLYVQEAYRKQGIGKRLLKAVGEKARERNAGRYEWCVLDWNKNAIQLYEQVGGEILDEWRIVRMDRKGIEALPEK